MFFQEMRDVSPHHSSHINVIHTSIPMSRVPQCPHNRSVAVTPSDSKSGYVLRIRAVSLASFHAIATAVMGSAMLTALLNAVPEPVHAATRVNSDDSFLTPLLSEQNHEWLTDVSQNMTPHNHPPHNTLTQVPLESTPIEQDSFAQELPIQEPFAQDPLTSERQGQLEDAQQRLLDQNSSQDNGASQQLDPEFNLYRLGPGDSIFANVQRFPEVNFQGTLDLQGNVIVPLVGIMSLQGLTIEQARADIQTQLARFYVDPIVDLTLVVQRPVQVTVLGEVVRPGLYPLSAPQLSLALLSAGGSTRLANLQSIQVRRTLRDSTGAVVDYIEQDVDLFTALAEGQQLPDIRLSDGDVVIIPTLTSEAAAQYDRALIARSNLAQPSISVRIMSRPQSIGNIVLPNGSDFLDAITAISPDQTVSNLREVALIRYVPETGGVERFEFNIRDAFRGDASQNPLLEDNDIIVVGRNLIGRITNALTTFTQPFRDILGFFLFFDTITDSAETIFRPSNSD